MSKKSNKTALRVEFSGGKWRTSDGLAFDTAGKAWNHIFEVNAEEKVKENNNGKDE